MSEPRNQNPTPLQSDKNVLNRLRSARDLAVQAAREAVRDTTRLTRLLTILNDPGPRNLLLDQVLFTLSELFLADIVILIDPIGTGSFIPLAAVGLPEDLLLLPFSDKDQGYIKTLMHTGNPLCIENAGSDQKIDFQLRDIGAETVLGLPLDGSLPDHGVLLLARCHPEPFVKEDIDLLMTMAFRIGQTLVEAQRTVQFEKIIQSGREINRHLNLDAVTAEAVRLFPVIVSADVSAIFLNDPAGKLYCAAQSGLSSKCANALAQLAERLLDSSHLQKGEPYNTGDIKTALEQLSLNALNVLPIRALLAIPIHRKDLIHGILFAVRFCAITFNSSTLKIATIYAEQVSAAIENANLYQKVQNELTERKKLEEERRKWERQQQQLQKAESLNRMAGAIAHHFNNMLAIVIGNLDLALIDPPQGAFLEYLNEAFTASHRAADISSLMLTYLGQSTAQHALLNLSGHCRINLPMLQVNLPKDVILETHLPLSGPSILGNAGQIQQVLDNLITNAAEACENIAGTIRLTIKTIPLTDIPVTHCAPVDWQPQDEVYACIEVKDNASGLTDKEIDQIFDPFYSTRFTGRGLGLSVVLGIVRAHQGVITVESSQGQGSIFSVFFPLSKEQALPRLIQPIQDLEIKPGKEKTILLVDDEKMIREMATKMLKRLGYKVIEAKDGVEAVDVFQQHQRSINAVLCDLTMPRMDGWETIEALRKLSPDTLIILSSGYDEAQLMKNDHVKHYNLFLHKPYQFSDLKTALTLLSFKSKTDLSSKV